MLLTFTIAGAAGIVIIKNTGGWLSRTATGTGNDMNTDLILSWPIGGVDKRLVAADHGGGPDGYFIYLNNYYQGTIAKRNGVWVMPDADKIFTPKIIARLGELLEEKYGPQ